MNKLDRRAEYDSISSQSNTGAEVLQLIGDHLRRRSGGSCGGRRHRQLKEEAAEPGLRDQSLHQEAAGHKTYQKT